MKIAPPPNFQVSVVYQDRPKIFSTDIWMSLLHAAYQAAKNPWLIAVQKFDATDRLRSAFPTFEFDNVFFAQNCHLLWAIELLAGFYTRDDKYQLLSYGVKLGQQSLAQGVIRQRDPGPRGSADDVGGSQEVASSVTSSDPSSSTAASGFLAVNSAIPSTGAVEYGQLRSSEVNTASSATSKRQAARPNHRRAVLDNDMETNLNMTNQDISYLDLIKQHTNSSDDLTDPSKISPDILASYTPLFKPIWPRKSRLCPRLFVFTAHLKTTTRLAFYPNLFWQHEVLTQVGLVRLLVAPLLDRHGISILSTQWMLGALEFTSNYLYDKNNYQEVETIIYWSGVPVGIVLMQRGGPISEEG